jgi:hypothetical protein
MNRSRVTLGLLITLTASAVRGQEIRLEDNAALQYWQAFSMFSEESRTMLDATEVGGRVGGDVREWLNDDNARLEYLHAGAAMSRCEWGLDFRKGPETLMPHLGQARYLAKLALLRAGHRFEHGRSRDGIDDVMATFELAKDVGDTPVILSLLVRYAIENMAIDMLGRHIPDMDRSALDHLATLLEPLPAEDSLKRVWPAQSEYMIGWALEQVGRIERQAAGDPAKWAEGLLELRKYFGGGDDRLRAAANNEVPAPAQVRATLQKLKDVLAELEKATDLPPAEQDKRVAEVQRPLEGDPVAMILIPKPQQSVFLTRRRWQTRHAMLDAAVGIAREGEGALKDKRFADPFGEGAPFDYRKTDGGFELHSKLTHEGAPVSLTVGAAAAPRS